ncbi:cadherin-like domain-containing protein [Salinimonas sp. HHU 13199]|uniref:Cadherin-like domain-containing protein n=1 Tax=Salinimonas profundi TaxID=2729140 RepID=A0ABR8LJ13_9ALTE|nr:NEW3 domain-containing protein [Salinimonas profundi]MBD3584307.1 cadherin-like domain-containing protein [Salinimonas profundi]
MISKGDVTPEKRLSFFKACGLALITSTLSFHTTSINAADKNTKPQQHVAIGAGQKHAGPDELKVQLERQTATLAKRVQRREANKTAQDYEQQLDALITERQQNQYAVLQHDPNAALRTILPAAKRKGMPAPIKAKLAQQAELVGEVDVVYEDSTLPGRTRLKYYLTTSKQKLRLFLPDDQNLPQLQTGNTVRAKGWLFKNGDPARPESSLVLGNKHRAIDVLAAGSDVENTATSSDAALTGTTGEQKVLVLMLNFQDNTSARPWAMQEVENMVFGRVNDYYQETSYGQTWLTGDVRGFYTLPINTTCDYFGLDRYAQQVAEDNGIDLSQYQRLVYMLPKNENCTWRGQGTVGGNPSRAWLNGELNLLTIGHELGHNLGLKHAKELNCGSGYISDDCVAITYGDTLDIMGKSEGHFNLFNKERLGWLTAQRGEIITADVDGSYQLEPYEQTSKGYAKGLKVRRGTDATTGDPLWYYLEYRQGTGFDSFLSGKAVTDGVLVHLNSPQENLASSLLLDMTPRSSIYDLDDAALTSGNSYHDSEAGVTMTTEWADNLSVGVNISYSEQQSCVAAQPDIVLGSDSSVWAAPGETVSYSATLTNNDSAECGNSEYNVSAQVPQEWSNSQELASLAPGESATVTVNVTSDSTATEGFYDVTIVGVNTSDSGYQASTTASYVVETPVAECVSANPQWTLHDNSSAEVAAGTAVTYSGTLINQDDASCAASTFDISASLPADWGATSPSVTLQPGESQAVNIDVASAADASAGVYDFSLIALNRDNSGYQSSASATYKVAAPTSSCQLAVPKLSVIDETGAEVEAGAEQLYRIDITNQNQDCDDATYDISIASPDGWNASSSTVTLASGATSIVDVRVVSSTSASAGSYNLVLSATDVVNTSYSSTSELVYRITEQQNTAPQARNDTAILPSKIAIYINVLSNDTDSDGDSLIVKSATQGSKGSVQILSDGRIQYTPAKNFKNGDSFSYTISDGNLQSSATVTISLDGAGGGNGGGGNKGKGKN